MKKFVFVILWLVSLPVLAQRYEIGIGLGTTNYTGDVSPTFDLRNFRPAGELFFRYNASYAVSLRANMLFGRLVGDDRRSNDLFQRQRGYYFASNVFEAGARMEYNFFNFRRKGRFEKWCPFLFGGASFVEYDTYLNGALEKTRYHGLVIPFGVGTKVFLSPYWNFGMEFGARKTFADSYDGLEYNETATKYQRVDANNDWYYYFGVSISYMFNRTNCPIHYYPLPY